MCSTVIASLEICLTSLVKNIILSLLSNYLKSKEVSVSEIAQLCPTLCDLMDCSLLGSSVHGIFQAIILEWVATSFSNILIKVNSPPLTICILIEVLTIDSNES